MYAIGHIHSLFPSPTSSHIPCYHSSPFLYVVVVAVYSSVNPKLVDGYEAIHWNMGKLPETKLLDKSYSPFLNSHQVLYFLSPGDGAPQASLPPMLECCLARSCACEHSCCEVMSGTAWWCQEDTIFYSSPRLLALKIFLPPILQCSLSLRGMRMVLMTQLGLKTPWTLPCGLTSWESLYEPQFAERKKKASLMRTECWSNLLVHR